MCDINAYLIRDGKEEKVMENLDVVKTEGDQMKLVNIFGEMKTLNARIVHFDNSSKKMVLVPVYARD